MRTKSAESISDREAAFWRAYLELLGERVQLVDRWDDGSVTWHTRVIQKLLWYSDILNMPRKPEHRARLADEHRDLP